MRSLHYLLGVGASKRLKVRRIFTQISPNLPQNTPKKTNSKKNKKTTTFLFMLDAFLQIKTLQTPFLPKFPQTFPKKLNQNMTSKKCLPLDFRCHYYKIKAHTAILRRYSHILPKFPQILPGFSLNQTFWGHLHHLQPRFLHQWRVILKLFIKQHIFNKRFTVG